MFGKLVRCNLQTDVATAVRSFRQAVTAAQIITSLQTIVARNVRPITTAVVCVNLAAKAAENMVGREVLVRQRINRPAAPSFFYNFYYLYFPKIL